MHSLAPWDDLRFFLAVAEHGSLSKAARALGVNQSTVFRRIAQLEDTLHARLFDRQPRGYALTGVGERLLPLAERVQDDVHGLERAVLGADQQLSGVVRLTTVLELLERVAPHLAEFQREYPQIQLEITTEMRVLSLGRHEADIALRPGLQPTEPDAVARRLVPLTVGWYGAAGYLDQMGRPRYEAELAGHRIVHHAQGTRPQPPPHGTTVVTEVDSKTSLRAAAVAGMGLALLPSFVGNHDPQLERLFGLPSQGVCLWLLTHADLRQTARVRALIDFLTLAIGDDGPAFEGSDAPAC